MPAYKIESDGSVSGLGTEAHNGKIISLQLAGDMFYNAPLMFPIIIVQFPGGKHWSRKGEQGNHGAWVEISEIVGVNEERNTIYYREITKYDVRAKPSKFEREMTPIQRAANLIKHGDNLNEKKYDDYGKVEVPVHGDPTGRQAALPDYVKLGV